VKQDTATFVVDLEERAVVDIETLKRLIEEWEGYGYRVGEVELVR